MTRTSIFTLSTFLIGALACQSPPSDSGGADKQASNQKNAVKPAPQPAVEPAPEPAPKPVEPVAEAPVEPVAEAPVEPLPDEAPAEAAPPSDDPNAAWKAPPGVDIRSDDAIPPGTPAANAEAFKSLPAAKADGPPVGGIGTNGIHFDTMIVGRGWEKSRCVEEAKVFDPSVDDRVNICLRVVHPADVEETLTVEWSKNGSKSTRKSSVTVKAMHAYLTRSYLPIKPNYTGDWTATITTADGVVLGKAEFTVE